MMNYDQTTNHQQWREELNARRAEIQRKLDAIGGAAGDGWQEIANDVDQEIAELSEVARSAIQQRTGR